MRKITLKSLIFASLVIGNKSYGGEFYIVKGKDNLTDILEENDLEPIYGTNGNLAKLIQLNPYLKNHSLYPGMRVLLPPKSPEKLRQIAEARALAAKVAVKTIEPAKLVEATKPIETTKSTDIKFVNLSAYKDHFKELKLNLSEDYKQSLRPFSLVEAQGYLGSLDISKSSTEFEFNELNLSPLSTREIRRIVLSEYPKSIPTNNQSPVVMSHEVLAVTPVHSATTVSEAAKPVLPLQLETSFEKDKEVSLTVIKLEAPEIVAENKVPKYLTPKEVKFDEMKEVTANGRRPASIDFEQPFWADGLYIQHFSFDISPAVTWRNILSQDQNIKQRATINALTEMNYGAHLQYNMHMNDGVKVYSFFNYERTTFIADSSVNLKASKFDFTELGAGFLYNDKWDFKFSNMDQYYLTSPSKTSVDVKKISMPKGEVGYYSSIYTYKAARIQSHVAGIVLGPRNTPSISSNFSLGGRLEVIATLKNQSFTIGYENLKLKAITNTTNSENIYWLYNWNL